MPTLRAPMLALLKRICGDGKLIFWALRNCDGSMHECPHCRCPHTIFYPHGEIDLERDRVYPINECFLCGAAWLGPDQLQWGWL